LPVALRIVLLLGSDNGSKGLKMADKEDRQYKMLFKKLKMQNN